MSENGKKKNDKTDEQNIALVTKLLTRAGHPGTPEEEARTAAFKAAQMIYVHGFVLVPAYSPRAPSRESSPDTRAADRAAQTAAATAVAAKRANEAYANQILDIFERQQPRGRGRAVTRESQLAQTIRSSWDGYCKACGHSYKAGEAISFMPGRGAVHTDCKSYWDTAR